MPIPAGRGRPISKSDASFDHVTTAGLFCHVGFLSRSVFVAHLGRSVASQPSVAQDPIFGDR